MAKHEVIIRENGGTTKTEAPYLPQYVKKNDLDFAAVCAQVAAESGLTETQVRAIFEGAFAEFESLEQEAAVRIHVDGMTVSMVIYGSFPSADAAFDPAKNTLALTITLDDDIRYALANVTPTIVTEDTATKVRITVVADYAQERPYEVIYGFRPFRVQGYNLMMDDEGAEIYLENAGGEKFPCKVSAQRSKQVVEAYLNELPDAGDYRLVVRSRGGDADGTLQTVYRRVKFIKALPEVAGVEITEWTLVEGGGTLNAIYGTNIPNCGFYGDGSDWDNTLKGFYTNPDTGSEVRVQIGPAMDPKQSKRLRFQPGAFYRAMSDVSTGVWCDARVELWCGGTKYGEASFSVCKG